MSKLARGVLACLLLLSFVAGCVPAAPAAAPAPVKETVVVEKEVPVEVTRVVEVEKIVEVEKEVPAAESAEAAAQPAGEQEWELVLPEGVQQIEPMQLAPRLDTLEGKKIVLRWNSKNNGDHFLDKLAELLAEEVPSAEIIKLWEVDPDSVGQAGSVERAKQRAAKIAELEPDIVIASQAD